MAKKRKTGPLVYVGPGFRNSRLSTFGLFADGVPDEFSGTIYEKLFVPVERLNEARQEVATSGSALNVFYKQALVEHAKEREK